AGSTAIVVSQCSTQSQNAFRSRAEALALASAKLAAHDVTVAARTGATVRKLPRIARQQDLELHVYDAKGVRIASASPHAAAEARKQERAALRVALQGERYVGSTSNGRVFVIGLPVAGGALVALNVRPDIAAASATGCACCSNACTRVSSPSTTSSSCISRTQRRGAFSAAGSPKATLSPIRGAGSRCASSQSGCSRPGRRSRRRT